MNHVFTRLTLRALGIAMAMMLPLATGNAFAADTEALLDDVIDGPHRTEDNRARDRYRHPKETLMFFGLRPDMTVVEISPGAGWYTEIIAPVLRERGKFYGAIPRLTSDMPDAMKRRDLAYREMVRLDSILYATTELTTYDAAAPVFAPSGSADLLLTFRNVHNWAKSGHTDAMFHAFFGTLKSGGILGVVEHRARPGTSLEKQINSGYMTEAYVIDAAQRAGFRLLDKSEINQNSKDTTDHPGGVWNLPPSLRGVPENEKPAYLAIGESDRMTLKFIKP